MDSTKKSARLAGLTYFIWMWMGIFGLMYVPSKVVVSGNATATAEKMIANELLFRTYIVTGLVSGVIWIFLTWLLYRLFRSVNEGQAKLMMVLVLVQIPVVFIAEALNLTSLMLFKGDLLQTLELSRRHEFAMLFMGINNYINLALELYWGLWLFPLATLVYRSRFLPRFLGVWLGVNGVAYIALCLTSLLQPQYKDLAFNIAIPAMFGEAVFALWLLIRGANTRHRLDQA